MSPPCFRGVTGGQTLSRPAPGRYGVGMTRPVAASRPRPAPVVELAPRLDGPTARLAVVLRALVALLVVVAVSAQWSASVATPVYRFVNFFGYFTIQSNLIMTLALVVGVVTVLSPAAASRWTDGLRGAATAYIATTGVVYNLLLTDAGLGSSASLPWASDVMHKVLPLYAVLDWIVFRDRAPIPWSRLPLFLAYPLAWTIVVLVRGQDFVPYPFLDVERLGGGVVAAYCVGIAVFIAGASALAIAATRFAFVRVEHPVDGPTARAQRSGS